MEHRKGFTLAELLAVIAILGVIALIAFPAVNKVIKNSKEKAYEAQKEIILSSAKNWGLDNLSSLSEEENTYLSIEELKQGGYLEAKQVVNPKTDEEMTGCVVIHYDSEYNQYVYEYNEAGCSEVSNIPVITLNGDKNITIGLGETYTELGAIAKYKELDISSSVEISGTVDTNTPGTYTIRYNVTYDGKKAKEVIRTVKVVNEDQPTDEMNVTLNPNKTEGYSKAVTVSVSTTGNVSSLTYKLNNGELKEITDNQIILDQDGEYIIEVIATDNEGNTKTITSETYYIDVTPPTIIFEEGDTGLSISTSKVVGYDLKTGVIVEDNHEISLDNVTTSGELSAQEGTYTITYTATDIAGNTTTKTRAIIVKKPVEILGEEVDEDQIMTNDPDENPRYVGPNPDNYVRFNNELWRIIGVFDGQAKIIRETPYNTSIAWDTNNMNDWNQATLKTELNGTFLNNIAAESKNYIDNNYIWKLGGWNTDNVTRSDLYNKERGTEVYSGRPTTWTGAIGLMYPSDYGYATNSNDLICDTTPMNAWTNGNYNSYEECVQKSWIHNNSRNQWTLTHSSQYSHIAFFIFTAGSVQHSNNTKMTYSASPVLYLKETVKIASGSGTSTDPYILTQEVDQTKTPVIELQVPNNTFNTNGWAKANFNISIISNNSEESEIKEYKYCYGENCTPDTTSTTNTIAITTESASNYVCATATNQLGNTSEKVCGGPYKLDKTAPTLTVPGSVTITPSQVSGYNLLTGANVTDSLSGVDGSITTSGSLSAIEKTYTITYTVRDKAGNSASKTRNIIVKSSTAADMVTDSSETMKNDPDGNPRYVGTNPNNYVRFNNELWRIIGVFNGQVKIVRNEPYNSSTYWDANNTSDWSRSTLQVELNNKYLNSIDSASKSYVDTNYMWKLGSLVATTTADMTREKFYRAERGTVVYSGNATSWTGAIGLIYASDYGYSVSSTNTFCDDSMYNGNTANQCLKNSWMYKESQFQWMIDTSDKSLVAYVIDGSGSVSLRTPGHSSTLSAVYPSLFLKPAVKITGGTGTSSNPYILTLDTNNLTEKVYGSTETARLDPDGNLRYVGSNPKNYVRFNNELWRIIGVFNGQVKIIRNTPYNTSIAWDKGSSAGGTHGTYGWNDWSQATLKTELNTTFLNSIDATSKSYIDASHIWNLGGSSGITSEWTRENIYSKERGTTVQSGRPTTWTGAIGLMYLSDYGYATSSVNDVCSTISMDGWRSGTAKTECVSKSWLYSSSGLQWTLTPNSGNAASVFYVHSGGDVSHTYTNYTSAASPVLYLKSDVKVKSGDGTYGSPYVLGT